MSNQWWAINYSRLKFHLNQGQECKLNLNFEHSLEVFIVGFGSVEVDMEFIHVFLILDILKIFPLQINIALSLRAHHSTGDLINFLEYH